MNKNILQMSTNYQLGNVQISYDGFMSNFRPHPLLYDGILTFSANSSPHMTFSTNPLPHIYLKSKINARNKRSTFLSN